VSPYINTVFFAAIAAVSAWALIRAIASQATMGWWRLDSYGYRLDAGPWLWWLLLSVVTMVAAIGSARLARHELLPDPPNSWHVECGDST
jgi:hypothetical protein